MAEEAAPAPAPPERVETVDLSEAGSEPEAPAPAPAHGSVAWTNAVADDENERRREPPEVHKAWTRLTHKYRWPILALTALSWALAPLAPGLLKECSNAVAAAPGSPSKRANRAIARAFPASHSSREGVQPSASAKATVPKVRKTPQLNSTVAASASA